MPKLEVQGGALADIAAEIQQNIKNGKI